MSSENHVKNVTIVGAGGLVGSEITKSLLEAGIFKITALSRAGSNSTVPSGVNVVKGDYNDPEFLVSALKGQDVLIITLSVRTDPGVQSDLIKAAAKAGVPWVLPNEWGQDGENEALAKAVFLLGVKERYRKEIEQLGVSSWIGVACSFWFDFSLPLGALGISIADRKAEIYDDGTTAITLSTLPQTGRAVARLLSLPIHALTASTPSLSDYKNKYIYINSFYASQQDMLAAVQRATGTKMDDWTVTHKPLDEWVEQGREKIAKGDHSGMIAIMYGCTFKKGFGDRFHGRELANKKLGLTEEKLDEIVDKVVKLVEEGDQGLAQYKT